MVHHARLLFIIEEPFVCVVLVHRGLSSDALASTRWNTEVLVVLVVQKLIEMNRWDQSLMVCNNLALPLFDFKTGPNILNRINSLWSRWRIWGGYDLPLLAFTQRQIHFLTDDPLTPQQVVIILGRQFTQNLQRLSVVFSHFNLCFFTFIFATQNNKRRC